MDSALDMRAYALRCRKRMGLTQDQLADKLSINKASVSAWETGRFEPSYGNIIRLSQLSGEPMPGTMPHQSPGVDIDMPVVHQVPIIGIISGAEDINANAVVVSPTEEMGHAKHFSSDWNAYGLKVSGDRLRPRARDGEIIIIEPGHQPQSGDFVLVLLNDGGRLIKELMYYRGGSYMFGSVNDQIAPSTVPADKIESMRYIAAMLPAGAWTGKESEGNKPSL